MVYQGGISNGEIVNMRVAFKPTPTIGVKSLSDAQKAHFEFVAQVLAESDLDRSLETKISRRHVRRHGGEL